MISNSDKSIYTVGILLFLATTKCGAEIYTWIDEDGVTQYSEQKPAGITAIEISKKLQKQGSVVKFEAPKPVDVHKQTKVFQPARLNIVIELVDYELNAKLHESIEENVNGIYKFYVTHLGWNPKPMRPITIRIFGKYRAFEDYQIKSRGKLTTNRSHYSSGYKEVLMLGTEFASSTLSVLYHESSHAIMNMEMSTTPKWLNEGLAEVFEHINVGSGDITLGYNPAWSEIIKHKLREGSLLPITDYLNISNQEWSDEPARVETTHYMIAWAMMRFLVSDQQGTQVLRTTISVCKQHKCRGTGQLVDILDQNYPGGIASLDSELRDWIKELR